MGHYASEMISDAEWEAERKWKKDRHDRIAANLKHAIDTVGLASVLATIVEDCEGSASRWNHDLPKPAEA
jgi:hypothetical protein